jgi:hypothetical protein
LSGSSWFNGNGVDVYSNGPYEGTGTSCGGSNSVNGVTTGSAWQCTELINRLYLTKGWIASTWTGNGGDSSSGANDSMYARAPANLSKNSNGSVASLSPGDVVSINEFYNGVFQSDGHVAVVNTSGTVTSGSIPLVSQNSGSPTSATPQIVASLSSGTVTISGDGVWSYSVIGVVHAPAGSQHRRSWSYGPVDFDHDGISDYAIDSGGQWAAKSGATGAYIAQGLALGDGNCIPMVGDIDGDGVGDFVVDCSGQWAAKSGATGAYIAQGLALGDGNCIPMVGDIDGDGFSDYIVDCSGQWAAKSGATGAYVAQGLALGDGNCTPMVGDANGDGFSDYIVDCSGQWAAKSGATGAYIMQGLALGDGSCTPMVGDLNKDHAVDVVVDCSGQWAARNTSGPYIAQGASLGDASCTSFIGDYNGDGYGDFAVDCSGQWAAKTTSGSYIAQGVSLGSSSDIGLSGMPAS